MRAVARFSCLAFAITLNGLDAPALAQEASASSDEAAIRRTIAENDNGTPLPTLKDRVLFSGALQKPVVGDEKPLSVAGVQDRKPGSQTTRTTIRRIEVAKAGDMAYEFSDVHLGFDMKDGTHTEFDASALRVWKKDQRTWKVVAHFTAPHQEATAR